MAAHLEVWTRAGPELVALAGERMSLGRGASNDLPLPADRRLSRLHAVLERYPAGWCVRDLGSRNGTFVNGERIWQDRLLRHGDELRVGATRLVYRADEPATSSSATAAAAAAPPELTRREREVLAALCRPVLGGDVFTEPATVRQVAAALVVTETAVKQHLLRLYDKFGLHGEGERRRARLANEAVRRGAVTVASLRGAEQPDR
jgi:DNA-binding CsgD family transcriptional regulator